ncbi:hypothetical protein ABH905_005278 [Pseudomonas frederiksbergensis]|uniref:hypothetical protein n=1 Tax=Pseudomonas frederiksbergensis TaxID=104087 RepID=UPI003D212F0F
MFRLNYTPLPLPNESAVSMLLRCATINGYKSLKLLNRAFELELNDNVARLWQGCATHRLLTRHSAITPEDKAQIDNAFHQLTHEKGRNFMNIHGVTFPASILRQELALCPTCIRTGCLNRMHIYRWSDVCPLHGESFLQRCPQCSSPFQWLKLDDFYCPCGFDLRTAPTTLQEHHSSKIIDRAMSENNNEFFSLLMACMNALRYLSTTDNRAMLLDVCVNIADGKKSSFFEEMFKLQKKMPSLHRRALVAPFILSQHPILSGYGMEYYFVTQQSKPAGHPVDCSCGNLLFTDKELEFVFATKENVTQLKLDKRCISAHNRTIFQTTLYNCPDMCASLINHNAITWDEKDKITIKPSPSKLLNVNEAAEVLHTSTARIRKLERAGLLKSVVLHKMEGLFTTLPLIKEFNDRYILKSEIRSRTTLKPAVVNYFLSQTSPLKIGGAPYAADLPVYRRDSLPKELLRAMNDTATNIIQHPLGPNSLITFSEASKQLKVNVKDIKPMLELGILRVAHTTKPNGAVGRDFCTGNSLEEALIWRASHSSLSEVSTKAKCNQHLVHSRYITSGFAEFIELSCNKFVTTETADKIVAHYKKFTTLHYFANEAGCTIKSISKLILSEKIFALPSDDPNYINGQIIFDRIQAKQALSEFYSAKPRSIRIASKDIHYI